MAKDVKGQRKAKNAVPLDSDKPFEMVELFKWLDTILIKKYSVDFEEIRGLDPVKAKEVLLRKAKAESRILKARAYFEGVIRHNAYMAQELSKKGQTITDLEIEIHRLKREVFKRDKENDLLIERLGQNLKR